MKQITTILASIILSITVFAQAPQTMSYQAVVRDSVNKLVQNSPIGMRVSILEGSVLGPAVYVETHNPTSNENGLITLKIGGGTIVSGTFQNGIFWAGGPYFIKTEIDPLGGTAYTITSTSELLSVPYSNYSHTSGYLISPATAIIGVYGEAFVQERAYITFLDHEKVLIKMNFQLRTDIDPDNGTFDYSWCGVINGNTITFPGSMNLGTLAVMTGTISGSQVNLSLYFSSDPGYIYTFNLQKL